MHARPIAALVLVAALAAACGGQPSAAPSIGAPTTAATLLPSPAASVPASSASADGALEEVRTAAEATIAEGTVSIEQTVEFNGNSSIPDGTKASLTGATSFTKPAQLRASADFAALGAGEFDMIRDDDLLYIRGSVVEALVGDKWLLVDITSNDPRAAGFKSLTTGQNDSSLLLYFLYGATEPVETLDDEELDGQPMHRLKLPVDLELALEQAPAEAKSSLQANVDGLETGGVGTTLSTDVWMGEDGLIHRVDYVYTMGAASGGGTMLVSCVFGDFGAPIDLGIPDDADVVNLEDA